MSFDQLGLSPKVLEAVTAAGYTNPTPIQAQAIPPALERRDVLGLAISASLNAPIPETRFGVFRM